MHLFGTSGIRAIADRNLAELAFKVGLAISNTGDRIVVGGDTRTSTEAVKHALVAGILFAGGNYHDAGVIPTPTLAFAAREFDAGVMITASHNPPEYNGLKLINPDGSAFVAHQRQQIEDAVQNDSLKVAPWTEIKGNQLYPGAVEQHIERIRQDFPDDIKLKVVVDSGCGAASLVTPRLLAQLGCEVIEINCYPSGLFPRDVEPIKSNLGELMKTTRDSGADLGIAHDGDGDRMMAVDEKGRFIPGDKLLAIFARELGAKEVVTTVDASMAIEEMGFKVSYTRVGDSYVSEEMRQGGDFGGEPSGSWVFPGISLCPDGVYAAALITAITSRQKLSALVDSIPGYLVLRGSIHSNGVALSNLEQQLLTLNPLSVSNIDGIKLNFRDSWLLVRPSGTEPKIRLTVEARNPETARGLFDNAVSITRTSTEGK